VRRKQNREKIPGIKGVSGSVFEASEPPSVVSVAYLTEEQARIYLERQDMTLTEDIGVNINSPGRYSSFAHVIRATVPKGRRIAISFNQQKSSDWVSPFTGSVTFEQEVLGVIILDRELDQSDSLRAPGTIYATGERFRGLEFPGTPGAKRGYDTITVEPDKRRITIPLGLGPYPGQIRNLTAAEP
jgi:hypothetical protein